MASMNTTTASALMMSAASSAMAAWLLASPAAAQAPAAHKTVADPNVITEVVVTAQKRSENIQRVPIAITAFTASTLKDKQITDVSGLTRLTPNVNLDTSSAFGGSNEVLSASIRGIGQDDFAINLDPGVGVYVDGIYYARTTGANVNMLDVDRLEILKGPQGTLFGRNTIGGAISVVTRTPGDAYTANAEVTGGSFNRRDFQATADIPIVADTVLSTLTFSSLNRDGYQKRVPYSATGYVADAPGSFGGAGNDTYSTQGGQGQDTLRAKVLWKAAPNLKVTATADWTHVNESSTAESLLQPVEGSSLGGLYDGCVAGAPGFLGPGTTTVCGPRGPGLTAAGTTVANPGLYGTNRLFWGPQYITKNIDTTYATGPDFDHMDNYGASLTLDWTLSPAMELKSITGYRRLNWDVALDTDGSPIDINQDAQKQAQHQFSEEIQLNGSLFEGKLNYTSGLYYFNEGGDEHDFVTLAGGTLQINGVDTIDTSSYAAYVHADYAVTSKLKIIAGARYSVDHKTLREDQIDANAFFPKLYGCYPLTAAVEASAACTGAHTGLGASGVGFPVPSNPELFTPDVENSRDFYVFTPTLGAQYQFTSSIMGYATYSKGYKDGGWTTRLTNYEQVLPSFGPEKSQTYEAGLKSEWLHHTLQANLTGFYTTYDGIQLNFQEGLSPTIQNAGNARIEGAEAEGRWILGHGFSIASTVGYIDAKYTHLEAGLNGTDTCVQPDSPCITLGSKLPKTPKWKTSISPVYDYALPNDARLRFGIDYTHTSSMFNDAFNTSLLRRPDTDNLNVAATYMAADDKYEVVVGGTNITDQRFLVTGNEDAASGLIYGTYNPPAEWYVTVRGKF